MTTLAELPGLAGQRLGPTEWREMTQARVNEFADVTEDHNYIHVDPERAKDSPFGVDVDVVVILGDVGELVDARLRHLPPVRRSEALPGQAGQLRQRGHQNS